MRKLNAILRLMSDCQLTFSPTDVAGGIYFHYVALNQAQQTANNMYEDG